MLGALVACAQGPSPSVSAGGLVSPPTERGAEPASATARIDLGQPRTQASELGPEILVPKTPAQDDVVAVVGDQRIYKSHVYDRLRETNLLGAKTFVDMLVLDAIVADRAREHGIRVDAARIEEMVDTEETALQERVKIEWGSRLDFDQYLVRQRGMTQEEYREFLRLEFARQYYRSLVIRFLAMLEERVEVRFVVNKDRQIVEEVKTKVEEGADFHTLAMRHSEDETRRDGGRMAPFGRSFQHPVSKVAFELRPGELSGVFSFEHNGVTQYCVVYCLRLMPRREVTFEEVREELAKELEDRPVTEFELKAFSMLWIGRVQPLNNESESR